MNKFLSVMLRDGNAADEQLGQDVEQFTSTTGITVSQLLRNALREYLTTWLRSQQLREIVARLEARQ